MKNNKDEKHTINIDWSQVFSWMIFGILILLVVAFIGLQIYALIAYGGKPASEVPWWVWWIHNGNRS